MAAYDIVALIPDTPAPGLATLRALGAADTYNLPRITEVAPGALTAAVAPFRITSTYNNAAVTFPGVVQNVVDTASNAASLLHDWQVGGVSKRAMRKDGAIILPGAGDEIMFQQGSNVLLRSANSGTEVFSARPIGALLIKALADAPAAHVRAQSSNGATTYFELYGEAAHVMGMRNGTNAQAFRVYNTFTDASNYERLTSSWAGNIATFGTEAAGTGTQRSLYLKAGSLQLWAASTYLTTTGGVTTVGFVPVSDGVMRLVDSSGSSFGRMQLGGSTASFPAIKRNGAAVEVRLADDSAAATLIAGSLEGSGGNLVLAGDVRLSRRAIGVLLLDNNGGADFGRLQFGGTTASFPSLKRSTTTLQVRLADDSGFGDLAARSLFATSGTLTADAPALDVTQTWNNAAVAFTGARTNVTDTASNAASLLHDWQVGGASRLSVRKDGALISGVGVGRALYSLNGTSGYVLSNAGIQGLTVERWDGAQVAIMQTSGATFPAQIGLGSIGAGADTFLVRDGAANIFGQRNGTNAQAFRVYNTFTDASNYERGFFRWNANTLEIGAEAAGTGSNRSVSLMAAGNVGISSALASIVIGTASGSRWVFSGTVFRPNVDLTDDIGQAASRVRDLFLGRQLSITGSTLTANAPALDITQTWNNAAITFQGIRANITDTASAADSRILDLQFGGVTKAFVNKNALAAISGVAGASSVASVSTVTNVAGGFYMDNGYNLSFFSEANSTLSNTVSTRIMTLNQAGGTGQLAFKSGLRVTWSSSATDPTAAPDVSLFRDAANTLAQRNGTAAQAFNIYNTFTDASNYERGFVRWSSNVLQIGTEALGTGVSRVIFIGGATNKGIFLEAGNNTVRIAPAGGPGPVFTSNGLSFTGWQGPTEYQIFGTTQAGVADRTGADVGLYPHGGSGSGAAGQVALYASLAQASGTAGHTFQLAVRTWLPATGTPGLQFGGTTASFPALKRVAAAVQVRLADDSDFAPVVPAYVEMTERTAPAAGAANTVRIYAEDNGSGKTRLMAVFGSGAPVQIAIEP